MPPLPPPNLNLQPIPNPRIPTLNPSLISSTFAIPQTWRADLLSTIPPNLQPWFLPVSDPEHYEIYETPIFSENVSRWRFEYRVALTHITGYFDGDGVFMREFKLIVGITFGSRDERMFDLMELIDCFELFIDGVKNKHRDERYYMRSRRFIPTHTPIPELDQPLSLETMTATAPPTATVAPRSDPSTMPRRTLQYESDDLHPDTAPATSSSRQSPESPGGSPCRSTCSCCDCYRRVNDRYEASRLADLIDLDRRSRWAFERLEQRANEFRDACEAGRRLGLEQRERWIQTIRDRAQQQELQRPVPRLKARIQVYSNEATKALITSPARLINEASKAIITTPGRLIKKCAGIFHRIPFPSFSPLSGETTPALEPKSESEFEAGAKAEAEPERVDDYRYMAPVNRQRIEIWAETTSPANGPPPSFINEYPLTAPCRPSPVFEQEHEIEVQTPGSRQVHAQPNIRSPSPVRYQRFRGGGYYNTETGRAHLRLLERFGFQV